jgi:long-chain acyl-CoA synthetase
MLFVGNPFLLKKFQKVESECPTVQKVVFMPSDKPEGGLVINYTTLIQQGQAVFEQYKDQIEVQFSKVEKSDLATLIYTSGTTGVPKGAMLSHYNFMSNCYDAKELCPAIGETDLYLSFLPLSHVFERMATMYLSTWVGASVAFSEGIEKVAANIMEIRPTVMATVPRLLERIHEKVVKNATAGGGIKAKIFNWSISVGEQLRIANAANKNIGPVLAIQGKIADKLVFSKIKAKMGGRMKMFVSGGGALPQHVGEFFANLGFKVQEGYGLTETSPFVTVNEFHRQVYGTVGRVAPRQFVAIQNIETLEIIAVQNFDDFNENYGSEEGEILTKGPNVMLGYWQNESETQKVFDADGWFHTGDIGYLDDSGFLKITDRKKEIFKNSGGKYIAPQPIENKLKESLFIQNALIVGEYQDHPAALIVPDKENILQHFNQVKLPLPSKELIHKDPQVRTLIHQEIKKLNQTLSITDKVHTFCLLDQEWTQDSGELTPTQKLRRKYIEEKYQTEIRQLFLSGAAPEKV